MWRILIQQSPPLGEHLSITPTTVSSGNARNALMMGFLVPSDFWPYPKEDSIGVRSVSLIFSCNYMIADLSLVCIRVTCICLQYFFTLTKDQAICFLVHIITYVYTYIPVYMFNYYIAAKC